MYGLLLYPCSVNKIVYLWTFSYTCDNLPKCIDCDLCHDVPLNLISKDLDAATFIIIIIVVIIVIVIALLVLL